MRKITYSIVSALLSLSLLTACTGGQTSSSIPGVSPESTAAVSSAPAVSASSEATPSDLPPEGDTQTPTEMRIAALKGPTAMGMVPMMNDADFKGDTELQFTIAGAVDEITPKLVKGEVDLAAAPANLASVLYNNTKGEIQVLAVNTLGVLYIVESGDTVQSVEDLRGKKIYASGKGATPEYALNYLLRQNKIDPAADVTIEWKSEHTECAAALLAEENAIAMLPQPFVTVAQQKNEKLRIALDMTAEWEKLQADRKNPSALITGVLVGRKAFVQEHPKAVSKFLDAYKASVESVNAQPEQAAELIGKYEIVPQPVALAALPYCNITYIDGAQMKDQLSGYLNVLYEQNPASVGGTLPADDFYFIR